MSDILQFQEGKPMGSNSQVNEDNCAQQESGASVVWCFKFHLNVNVKDP